MKANRNFGMLKAIAFMTIVSLFSCTSCDNEPLIKAKVTISATENITTTTATIVALVIPNQENTTVSFKYQADNSAWVTNTLPTKFRGSDPIKVTLDLSDLQPGTRYNFEVLASNAAGLDTSSISSFSTVGLIKAIVKIKSAENVKISTASLNALVIPNQENSSVSFEYQTANSAWQSQTLGSTFSGTDSVKVNFDLSSLQANTSYNFRVKVSNKAGEVVSDIASFTTYAVTDYDGNLYHTVTIGTQTWLKENLKTAHYANGDPVTNVTDTATWNTLTTGAYCWYNNDVNIGNVYGALYNGYVACDQRDLIVGWHTPDDNEWASLVNNLGGWYPAGLATMETGSSHWINVKLPVTNSSGFTILPNGCFGTQNVTTNVLFMDLGYSASFWSSSSMGTSAVATSIDGSRCGLTPNAVYSKNYGFGIRLLKN